MRARGLAAGVIFLLTGFGFGVVLAGAVVVVAGFAGAVVAGAAGLGAVVAAGVATFETGWPTGVALLLFMPDELTGAGVVDS